MTTTAITQSLGHLLPVGYAWPRDPSSVWMRVIDALAANLQEHDDWVVGTVARWQPHQTTRLAEWEEACSLPDRCYGADTSDAARRAAVLVRLRGVTRLVDDGSPAAPSAIEVLCSAMGALCTVSVNTPARVGLARAGDRLGQNGRMHVHLLRNLGTQTDEALLVRLGCALERIVPARYELVTRAGLQVVVRPDLIGWPGARTNCSIAGSVLVINDTSTWDQAPTTWDAWLAWSSAAGSIGYEHPAVDTGVLRRCVVDLGAIASGAVVSELSTSVDGVTWSAWAAAPTGLIFARYFKARWTVSGTNPELKAATIMITY